MEKTKIPVNKKKNGNSFGSPEINSIWSFRNQPIKITGIEPTMIYLRLVKKYLVWCRKRKITEINVAVWRKISKSRDGINLKKYWIKLRCPSEEMGKNSLMAWTRPRVKDWIRVMDLVYQFFSLSSKK